jgi:hypothetical protein
LPRAEIAEGEAGFGRIGGPLAGQLEIEPVLAVKGVGDAIDGFRRILEYPAKLRTLLAGGQACAGGAKAGEIAAVAAQPINHAARARIKPKPGLADRIA